MSTQGPGAAGPTTVSGNASPRSVPWGELFREVLLVSAAVGVYFGVRGETVAAPGRAFANARQVMGLEGRLGIDVEAAVQAPFLHSDVATDVMNWVYIWGHWPVIVAVLTWLFLRHADAYRRTLSALLLSGLVGLVVFATYPVAPPRLVDPTLVDTVTERSDAYRVLQPPAFTNPYAAMPSLHAGWDLLIGIALFMSASHLALKALGVLLPLAMTLAVVATANHYVLDAVAGISLVLACLFVTSWSADRLRARRVVPLPDPRHPPGVPGHARPPEPAPPAGRHRQVRQ